MSQEAKIKNRSAVQMLVWQGRSVPADMLFDLELDEVPMLMEPILPKVGLVGLFGSSDTGKSAFLRQLSIAISSGADEFLGFKLNLNYGAALYVSTEDDHNATSTFIRKQSRLNRDSLKNLRFLFDTQNLVQRLDQELNDQPVDVIIIDAYSDIFRGDMNQAAAVRSFLNDFSALAARHDCLVIFLHHSGKGRQNSVPGKDNILGSQGFESKMRLVAEFRTDPNDASIRHLCIVKGNYLKADDKVKSFALRLNENMIFANTGDKVPFDDLVPMEQRGAIHDPEIVRQVMQLSKNGLSTRKIEEELSALGMPLGKSSINRIIQKNSDTFDFGKSWIPPKTPPRIENIDDGEDDAVLV